MTIYHDPACGTSRNRLAMIRTSGMEPEVIEYLIIPPDRETISRLIAAMQITTRQLLRKKDNPYQDIGLADTSLSDDALIASYAGTSYSHQPSYCGHHQRCTFVPSL